MLLEVDIVEVGEVAETLFLHDAFGVVLTLVPSPGLVDLAEVFDDEGTLFDAVGVEAAGSLALRVDPEAGLVDVQVKHFQQVLCKDFVDDFEHACGGIVNRLREFPKKVSLLGLLRAVVDDELACLPHVPPFRPIEVGGLQQVVDKVRLLSLVVPKCHIHHSRLR